ncbi:MAG: helix-turn-helix transcriptional regulator, partial [Chloroflexota bacterium]
RRWVEDCQVRIWVDQGDIENLERWMNSSDLQINVEPDYKRDIEHIILARTMVALAKDRPRASYLKDAIMLLSNLEKLAESAGWYGKLIEILALQSKAFLLDDREEQAIDTLEKAILLAEPEGYLRTFVDEGKPMHYLLQMVSRNESLQVYIRRLLALFEPVQLIDQEYISLIEVEPLSSRELDVMKMLATDLSGPEISQEMNIALSTLRFHTRNIYGKLMVNNRRSAVRRATESKLI